MHNGFSCYHKKRGVNKDERRTAVLWLEERDAGIELTIRVRDESKSGTSFSIKKTSRLTLTTLSLDDVLDFVKLLEQWLLSESHPGVDIEFDDIEGIFSWEKPGSTRRRPESAEQEISGIKISINKIQVNFSFWDDMDGHWQSVVIPSAEYKNDDVPEDIKNVTKLYNTFYDFLTFEYSGKVEYFEDEGHVSSENSAIHRIEQIFNRFSEIAIPLRVRREGRDPLTMDDEYDVQYLLHALLKLHFDDVRREPHTERHSSVSPRIDFLVQNETIGIEVKRASPNQREKSIRNDLAEDKEQYRHDTNIDILLIFVYDPEKQIENKAEFEDSFNQKTPQMETRVTVTR